ncbi:MAG: hypothetical protein DRN53_05305, partial [Thermoprotei archaeon]
MIILCITVLTVPMRTLNSSSNETVVIVYIDERIDEGAVLLIRRGISACIGQKATYLILAFNTYGGYLYSMDKIIESLARSPCKRIAWVPPSS